MSRTYYAELLPKLKRFIVFLQLGSTAIASLDVGFLCTSDKISAARDGNFLTFKISAESGDFNETNEVKSVIETLESSERQDLVGCSIRCRECTAQLMRAPIVRVSGMPSDGWKEMADLWVCDPMTFSQFRVEDVVPEHKSALLGTSVLQVNFSDIVFPGISYTSLRVNGPREDAFCRGCHSQVGYVRAPYQSVNKLVTELDPKPLTFLLKHRISAVDSQRQQSVFQGYNVGSFLASLLMERLESLLDPRLVVHSSETDNTIVMELVGQGSKASFGYIDLGHETTMKLCAHVRVLYTVLEPGMSNSNGENDRVHLTGDDFSRLEKVLARSSECLPESFRSVYGGSTSQDDNICNCLGLLALPHKPNG